MSKQSVVGLAKSILEPVEQVKMAFLFGSRATARARSDSDVDIAVYWEPRPSRRQRERVWEGLEKALGTEVDLVDLNDCPATLAWEALQGIPLIKRDERFHLEYMLEVSREAEDWQEYLFDLWRWRRRLARQ
ncbi:MAG: nucleotidyltransferase domain-containing protein [Clostridia bacterium]|jgi:predicted nucleotidyltransferase|nr:nucleotidyltransferase domain-containing protein [Clostridia bacterium]MDH7573643.1 nucleotidyltransferase domain-containing protein [Clostridia bacterium]